MPELPEVETIKNELLPHIVGHQITGVSLFWDGIICQPSVKEFCSRLIGQRLTGVTRRGKYLILGLTSHEVLIIHLKMTGSLLLKPASAETDRFIRAILHLDRETALHFRDPRKLGVMWLVEDKDTIIGKLGPEPLEADFTPQTLSERLNNRTAPIKALLCDQTFIAGIGNMYADEALFAAGIHPLRSGGSLSRDEVERLHSAIQQVLWSAINNKGASTSTYFRPSGELGTAHFQFQVAHRLSGNFCPVCGTPVERIVVRNRGTYFCPQCQPMNCNIMLDYIEQFGLSETDRTKYFNELKSLNYLKVGLEFLYKNVKKIEDEVAKQTPQDKCILYYGNHPSIAWIPNELIACSFHWYSVSICNYVWLVGWIRRTQNPDSPTAKQYLNSVIPKAVKDWRDKVAAHFARADNDKRDTPVEREFSVFHPFGFYDDAFYASPMKLIKTQDGVRSDSASISRWSLTKVHEQLRPRYWPEV